MRGPASAARRALTLVTAALLLTTCGVRAEPRPEPLRLPTGPPVTAAPQSPVAGARLTVFFVRDVDLTPRERRTTSVTALRALELLVDGPTRAEAATGIRTALVPEALGADGQLGDGLMTVSVGRGYTGLNGADQLLAVAQIVWTLTELPTITAVRFVVDGRPVEVPTDAGLTDRPVDRRDFRSVTPPEPAPAGPSITRSASPSGSPPTR